MNNLLGIADILKDFWQIQEKNNKLLIILQLLLTFIICTVISRIFNINDASQFSNDYLNNMLTALSLFTSFSIGYLTILVTSDGSSIQKIKTIIKEDSKIDKSKTCKGKSVSLYQFLLTQISYTILIEIILLFVTLIQKFLISVEINNYFIINFIIKYSIILNFTIFTHILITIFLLIKNTYYTFWNNKEE